MTDVLRIRRERKTVDTMIHLYCRKNYGTDDQLCPKCKELHEYTILRLSKCSFQEDKTTCEKCSVYCHKSDMKTKIAKVIRY
ncbi:MAG: nitrous oxide-stimulated promoter family protein [Candidatus Bathyarchaeota archaeon]|nr:nitrous oxide-stimulated promoter family protein [Candidatus Bathyarchaeota archaeon]